LLPGLVFASCPHEQDGLLKWSDAASWDEAMVPGEGHEVVITKPILLDSVTERVRSVTILDGGKLVFDPSAELAKITTNQILIDDGGEMHIGSADCKFTGKAEVLLTGTIDHDSMEDPDFGRKFIGVKAGGSLEIHGEDRTPFVQLAHTLEPKAVIYEGSNDHTMSVVFYEFDRNTGQLLGEHSASSFWTLKGVLKTFSDSSVVVMASRGTSVPTDSEPFQIQLFKKVDRFVSFLTDQFGPSTLPDLQSQWTSVYDAFIVMIDKAPDGTVTVYPEIDHFDEDKTYTKTRRMVQDINGIRYIAQNEVRATRTHKRNQFDVLVAVAEDRDINEIELTGDVSDWRPGDSVVIASTDFDFEQAEEFEIVSVDGNKITLQGEIKFSHYGEEYETINMRAEVGLLTRNVLIHGEMGETCQDVGTPACDEVDFDNYGGHTKAVEGFKSYNIEGAELTHMGQMSILGRYPIHYHMCKDTDSEGVNPVVQGNSIHHCFSRCVTIHGTHGVHVKNNVAHDTYGHCFFLEDGGEKRNVFEGNLGLTTRKGYLTQSDTEPTTFWLTSPLVTVNNNHAAGSDGDMGVGFWYIFPDEPAGPSKGMFYGLREAKHTPITEFKNNVAHSNGQFGLGFFRRLGEHHEILSCSTYDPREDPLDPKHAEVVPVVLDGYTGFKNKQGGVKMRSTASNLINFKLADNLIGVWFNRLMLSGYQMIKDSLIIAETPNKGKPNAFRVWEDGQWVYKFRDRSIPNTRKPHTYVAGVYIDNEGPLHVHNVEFKGFKSNIYREACAIEFMDFYNVGMSPTSTVKGLSFDFEEPEALRVCHQNQKTGADELAMILKDEDGSLTGTPGVSVMSRDDYLQEGLECEQNGDWNMTLCKGDFTRFYVFPKNDQSGSTFISRVGDTDARPDIDKMWRVGTSYIMRQDVKIVMHWTESFKPWWFVRVVGVKKGQPTIIGFCLPKGAETLSPGEYMDFSNEDGNNDSSDVLLADSLEDLEQDTTGKNVFLDTSTRVLFIKFEEHKERTADDLADCPGGNLIGLHCPWAQFNFLGLIRKEYPIDFNDAQCLPQ